MVRVLKKEVFKIPKIDKKRIITIAEKENSKTKHLVYYLSYLMGNKEIKKKLITKKDYKQIKEREILVDEINF